MSQMTQIPKPPIGVLPQKIWKLFLENPSSPSKTEVLKRIESLKSAIGRYEKSSYSPRIEWQIEINRHELFLLRS